MKIVQVKNLSGDVPPDEEKAMEEHESESNDEGPVQTSFMTSLRTFAPADPKKSTTAAPKAAPKATAPKASAHASRNRKTQAAASKRTAEVPKVAIGKAKRAKVTDDLEMCMDAATEEPPEFSEADKDLLDGFVNRFAFAKKLEPPLADAPFKSYIQDRITKLNALKNDVKAKRRSALRRQDKENDPLYIELGKLSDKADTYMHLLKCSSDSKVYSLFFLTFNG